MHNRELLRLAEAQAANLIKQEDDLIISLTNSLSSREYVFTVKCANELMQLDIDLENAKSVIKSLKDQIFIDSMKDA